VYSSENLIDSKKGLMNINSNIIIEPKYDKIEDYLNDYNLIKVELNNKVGFINPEGREIIKTDYVINKNEAFSESLIALSFNGNFGFLDNNGKTVIPFIYKDATKFIDGLAGVKLKEKWGFINQNNEIVIPFMYDKIYPFYNDLSAVQKGDIWFFINKKNKEKFTFNNNDQFSHFYSNGLRLFKDEETKKYGFKDLKNKVVIKSQFDEALPFVDQMARVKLNDKYGYINKIGKIIIPIIYSELWDEREGLIRFME
jgi:hypothetical protein